MIRWKNRHPVDWTMDENGNSVSIDDGVIVCLSSDAKPTQYIANGAMLIEEDTQTVYLFDEENAVWREF